LFLNCLLSKLSESSPKVFEKSAEAQYFDDKNDYDKKRVHNGRKCSGWAWQNSSTASTPWNIIGNSRDHQP
jgi:hypothetical protein